ncbi:hypothetical protein IMZ48_43850 [Candidatus Bathyarchaeota archaeon]|nr:hypothetical protein [Candidatus Bathyarchaeota archaeon]
MPYDEDFFTGASGTLTSSKSSCPTDLIVHQSIHHVSRRSAKVEAEAPVQTPPTTHQRPRPVSAFFMR